MRTTSYAHAAGARRDPGHDGIHDVYNLFSSTILAAQERAAILDMLGRENVFVSVSDAVGLAARQLSERGYGSVLVPSSAPDPFARVAKPSSSGVAAAVAVAEANGGAGPAAPGGAGG